MPRTAETNRSVLERRPLGSEISLTVYHSIIRGNKGRGIVNAKRSRTSDRKTIRSTFPMFSFRGASLEDDIHDPRSNCASEYDIRPRQKFGDLNNGSSANGKSDSQASCEYTRALSQYVFKF